MSVALDTIVAALAEAGLLVDRRGSLPASVTSLADDSRRVERGGAFLAVRGSDRDGHDYLASATERGAAVAIVEDPARTALPALIVRDGRRAAAIAAAAFYGWPARQLKLLGVTGTNGKTTTVNMLRSVLDDGAENVGTRSASIGTLGVLVGYEGAPMDGGGGLTTPGPVELQRRFRDLVAMGVGHVAMEVSSHALSQRRAEGTNFDVAIFTNLSRDHLDYHGSMDEYFAAKARLLDLLRPNGTVVVNLDDPAWEGLRADRRRMGFSARITSADVHAEDVRFHARGSEWVLALGDERHAVTLPLIGDFNIANALAAAAGAWAIGLPGARIAERLSSLPQVPGRLELVNEEPAVLRDYAHTPDALDRALDAVRPFTRGRLIVVFGCGGDRDPGKRPQMGAIAAAKADVAIVTSDNPRTEDPERILDEIEGGMRGAAHERIEDRRAAIARALEVAGEGDVIVLAGKGHETYQVRGTTRLPFDEKAIVGELVAERSLSSRSAAAP
jgi:UDP-N-acetylmuramoyl-L-alanyl-D-glutamate--2,6-diaminopimelate ligase